MKENIKGFSPLTETTFFILLALNEPLHGYGIMNMVNELSSGRIKLGPGTLYGALSNLVESKLIEPLANDKRSRRKTYRITSSGRKLLEYEIKRLKEIVKTANDFIRKGSGKYERYK